MSNDLRDWLSFAIGLVSLVLTIWPMLRERKPQTSHRLRERLRTLQIGSWVQVDPAMIATKTAAPDTLPALI
jgi:hypothetical protein